MKKQAIAIEQMVTETDVDNAAEILIKRRDVHLDQLADKLTEPRVARNMNRGMTAQCRFLSATTTRIVYINTFAKFFTVSH